MNTNLEESQLAMLSPRAVPDCAALLTDLKFALNRAANFNLWGRMEHNHDARYCRWPGHHVSCRKRLVPGESAPKPWPNAADLEVRLVDQICKEQQDLLMIADRRTQPHILPADLDAENENGMNTSELWGGVLEHYRETEEYDMQRAKAELCSIAQEYGHGIMFVGWKEERQLMKKTLDEQTVMQLVAMMWINEAQSGMQGETQRHGGTEMDMGYEEPAGMPALPEGALPGQEEMTQEALGAAAEMIMDPELEGFLVQKLREIDPDMPEKEARRVARRLRNGEPVDYSAPTIVRSGPDWRARTPGLDLFYPPETPTIQQAQFIVDAEWLSDTQMRGKTGTWEKWNKKNVERVIKETKPGRAAFFSGIATGVSSTAGFTWQLTSGMIGMAPGPADMTGEQQMRQWQVITVRYRAVDPDTGVPVLYETTFHPDLPKAPLRHAWSVNDHAQYPYVEAKREMQAPALWASRGIGELSFSEQEELRAQANFCFDNAAITIMPPYEAPPRSTVAIDGLKPGMRVDAIGGMSSGVKALQVGGDMRPSLEVQRQARARAFDYHKLGQSEEMDPIAKATAQQARVNDWVLTMKQAYRMTFSVIQQFAPDEVRFTSLHGMPVDMRVSRAEIQGRFTCYLEFDVTDLDPKAVESRAKMVRELVAPLDREGLLKVEPLLRLLLLSINPRWAKLMMNTTAAAEEEQTELATQNMMRVLLGIEAKYLKGGNPVVRAQKAQQIASMPMLDAKGQPVTNEAGEPLPGLAQRILQLNPDAAALYENMLGHEKFEFEQQKNVERGRKGVKEIQEGAAPQFAMP